MLNYQVRRPVPVYEAPVTPHLVAIDSRYNMVDPRPQGYSLDELQMLASTASSQYLDLESAENELAAWIRSANRGPQALPSNGSISGKLLYISLQCSAATCPSTDPTSPEPLALGIRACKYKCTNQSQRHYQC